MPSYALTTSSGTANGIVGRRFTFVLTPSATMTDTDSLSDGGMGGTFTPTGLSFTASAVPQTFVYRPITAKVITITVTSTNGYVVAGSPFTLKVATRKRWCAMRYPRGASPICSPKTE
jgi:hypothetical protein